MQWLIRIEGLLGELMQHHGVFTHKYLSLYIHIDVYIYIHI